MPVLPLAILIVSGVAYHLTQRAASAGRLWPMLASAYGVAFIAALALAVFASDPARAQPGRERVAGLALGASAFGIEAALYFIYRGGAPLASVSVIASVAVTAVLATIGVLVFGDELTASRAIGVVFAVLGSALIVRGGA